MKEDRTVEGNAPWEYSRRRWVQLPHFVNFLPAPEEFNKEMKRVWLDRGYGLWGEYDEIQRLGLAAIPEEARSLLKSVIADIIICSDSDLFSSLPTNDRKRKAYEEVRTNNDLRLLARRSALEHLLEEYEQEVPGIVNTVQEAIKISGFSFVRDCKREGSDSGATNNFVAINLERNLATVGILTAVVVPKSLPISFRGRDYQDAKSLVESLKQG